MKDFLFSILITENEILFNLGNDVVIEILFVLLIFLKNLKL